MLKTSILDMGLKITNLRLQLHFPGSGESNSQKTCFLYSLMSYGVMISSTLTYGEEKNDNVVMSMG